MKAWEVAGALHRLELLRRIRIRQMMNRRGIHPGQPRMMHYIDAHPGCTQKEVAQALDITQASAAASLKRLEKNGLIRRRQDAQDARRNCLFLTDDGKQHMLAGQQDMEGLDREMLSGIAEKELQLFKVLCDRMFDNLADETTRHLSICKLHKQADE